MTDATSAIIDRITEATANLSGPSGFTPYRKDEIDFVIHADPPNPNPSQRVSILSKT